MMDTVTLKALGGSIQKWEKIVAGTGIDEEALNCPLCFLFWKGKRNCIACPVFLKTGGKHCGESPYSEWIDHQNEWHHTPKFKRQIICPTCRRLAKTELAFLKSLLPK